MTNLTYRIAGALFCLYVAGPLPAPIGSFKAVDEMFVASDVIVVGTIEQGTVSGTTLAVSIQIERCLKGAYQPGAVISATGTLAAASPTRAAAHDRAMFFLGNAPGPLRLIPVTSGVVPFERWIYLPLPNRSSPAVTSTSVKERVSLEILAGIEAGPLKEPGGYIDPESAYTAAPTATVRSVFYRWLHSDSPMLASLSLNVLLGAGDTSALAGLMSDKRLRSSWVQPGAYDGLKYHFKNADTTAVQSLGQLVTDNSNSLDLRIAAATSLWRIHTRQALPFLAEMLDSPDSTIRSCGVGGLASFANHVPIGSLEPAAGEWRWRTDETIAHSAVKDSQDSIHFWKNWWAANQASLKE
jgi:hypothetical protein